MKYHFKDHVSKSLFAIPDVFADLINNDLYDGHRYVFPENVLFLNTVPRDVKTEDGRVGERICDVHALVVAKQPDGQVPFIFGLEPQTSRTKCMPVRNEGCDFKTMMNQIHDGVQVPLNMEEWKVSQGQGNDASVS
ncbi:MAG: hypothetical protein ACI32N_08230 [Bulleidia sp.]